MSLRYRSAAIVLAYIIGASACVPAHTARRTATIGEPPTALVGAYEDDYGGVYRITADSWRHGATAVYDVVAWHADSQYVVARNAPGNPSAPNQWTRIDWMPLTDMLPYTWAFCFTAYDAPTRRAAETTPAAVRATPRSGCNGFPFSRMKRRAE